MTEDDAVSLWCEQAAVTRLRSALEKAAAQFRTYEQEHVQKAFAVPGAYAASTAKADTNRRSAEMCDAALASADIAERHCGGGAIEAQRPILLDVVAPGYSGGGSAALFEQLLDEIERRVGANIASGQGELAAILQRTYDLTPSGRR